jgi:hypothetical protein
MASAVEALWQWFFVVLFFLTIMILICCCGGCYEPFTRNLRGFCSEGCDCGLGMFRRTKTRKKRKATIVDSSRQGEPGVIATPGGVAVKVEETDEDEEDAPFDDSCLRSCCGGLFAALTCWYCCGTLAPEERNARRELRRPLVNVAQPVALPKKSTKPGAVAPVVAVPSARVEVPGAAEAVEVVGTEASVASHVPLLTL